MVMFSIQSGTRAAVLELGKIRPAMVSAIDRFARRIRRADARHAAQLRRDRSQLQRRVTGMRRRPRRLRRGSSRSASLTPIWTRLPSLGGRRPMPHRFALPPRLSRRVPPTVLERQRRLAGRGGRPPFAESVERGAERAANAIRARLLALRGGLASLQRRLSALTRSGRRAGAH
jgi:hypothetical protein